MSARDPEPSLSADALQRLAAVVELFDRAWREGTPRLEDFLGRADERDATLDAAQDSRFRAALFGELLAVEIEYRRQRGDVPQPADYVTRFASESGRIERACRSEEEREQSAIESTRLEGAGPPHPVVHGAIRSVGTHGGRIGPYVIERELGRGGMGVVYLARREQTNDHVAVKTLLTPYSHEHAVRFRREARAAASIQSDHVVPIYGVDEDAGRPYFVMPFIDGGQLLDLIATGPLEGRRAARLIGPVARALGELHRQGVLHRDLKPSNILYDRARDRALLTDFGLAKFAEADLPQSDANQTLTKAVFGTPSYMAPEQTHDSGKVTVAADIYGLGATLYQLVTGRRLFHGVTDPVEMLRMIREVDPVPARLVHPAVARDLDAILQKCLEKPPERRYRSADELADELEAFAEGWPVQARPVSKPTRLVRWCARHPLATTLMSVLFVGVISTSWLLWQTWQARERERLAFWRESEANSKVAKQADDLKSLNADLEQEVVKSRRLTNEAEGGQYDLLFNRFSRAFHDGRYGEVTDRRVSVPASQIGWELTRLRYKASLLEPRLVAQYGEHDAPVLDAVVSPDGTRLVSCGAEGLVMVWNLETNRADRVLLNGRWNEAKRRRSHFLTDWFAKGREPTNPLDDVPEADDEAWPPNAVCPVDLEWLGKTNRFAAASLDGQGLLIETDTGADTGIVTVTTLVSDVDSLECVSASADGSRVLFGGRTGNVYLCDPNNPTAAPLKRQLESAVVTLRCVENVGWLAGCEDGRLLLLDAQRLDTLAETTVPGPVWSVDAVTVGNRIEVVVGSQQKSPRVYELLPGDAPSFRQIDVLDLPNGDSIITAIHSVRFDPSGREVCAVDQTGRVFVWMREERRLRWATAPLRDDAIRRFADKATRRGWPFPRSLERASAIGAYRTISAAAVEQPKNVPAESEWELFVCSPEFVVRRLAWSSSPDKNMPPVQTSLSLPASPQIAFDPEQSGLLWCLAGDGHLSLIDSASGRVFDEATAHTQAGSALIPIPPAHRLLAGGEFLTVGEEDSLQAWRCNPDRRLHRGTFRLVHDRPLLSASISPTEPLVAGVDDTATLTVWSLTDGHRVRSVKLSEQADRPVTGRVAFDPTGRWLAAFGSGTTLEVFQMEPFERVVIPQFDVEQWGTALLWNPVERGMLFAADHGRRLMVGDAGHRIKLDTPLGNWRRPVVALKPSIDGRRVFALTVDGQVEVIDTRHKRVVESYEAGPGEASELAVDPLEGRVAIAFRDGRTEVWQSQRSGSPSGVEIVPVTDAWQMKELVTQTPPKFHMADRATVLDEQGRVALLALRGQSHYEELVYLKETDGGMETELIEAGGLEYSESAFALALETGGQPVAVYRGGYDPGGTRGKFAFDLKVARRRNDSGAAWHHESTGLVGNVGRSPCPIVRDGRLEQILCHREEGYYLFQISRTDDGWQPGNWVGRNGDGIGLSMSLSAGEPLFVFNTRPQGAVPSIPQLGWFEGADWKREAIDPAVVNFVAVCRLPDGSPLVLIERANDIVLAQRAASGTWTSEPAPTRDVGPFCCDTLGRIHLLGLDPARGVLSLYSRGETHERGQNVWTKSVVAKDVETRSGWATIRLDARQRPVIVSTNPIAGRPGVRVFRRGVGL